ncbi:hypothetical protein HBB16_02600 [Pseudonocardia sp. MCCB 268]|nr:hypothetical protein [Pseudonocardia cytotoxica]
MSFIGIQLPAGLVLRVPGHPASTCTTGGPAASPSRRELDDAALLEQIVKVRSVNGSTPRPMARRGCGWSCAARACGSGAKRIRADHARPRPAGRASASGLEAHGSARRDRTTAAPDRVERNFRADAPNRLWVADLTRLVTGEGCAVAGQRAGCVRQPGRRLGHR